MRQPKRLAILAYLALAATNGFRRRDQIVALFWPDRDQFHARTQLRKVLHTLRSVLGTDAFLTRGEDEIRLNVQRVWCDAVEFRQAIESRAWALANNLYRGDLLEGLFPGGVGQQFEQWLEDHRGALREQAAHAAWECSSLADLSGNRERAIAFARQAVDLNADDEQSVRRLIAALDRYGDRAAALRVFSEWQKRLLAEFGAEPSPETRKLVRRVQAHRKGESAETPNRIFPVTDHRQQTKERAMDVTTPSPQIALVRARGQTLPTRNWVAAAVAAALIVTILGMWRAADSVTPAAVAVLPFRGLGDASAQLLGASLAEEIATQLAQVSGITVRASARSRVARESANIDSVGRALEVRHLFEGSVVRDARRAHVRIRLVRVSDGLTVWARGFEVASTDFVTEEARIARETVQAVADLLRANQ